MLKKIFTLLFTGIVCFQAFALSDTTKYRFTVEDTHILDALDSLTSLLYTSNSFYPDRLFSNKNIKTDVVPVFSDSVYAYRIATIPSPIEMVYNEHVKRYIHVYTVQRRPQMQKMLGLAQLYFPMFEEILDKYDLPLELKYLPIIESALNPMAVSRAGATGLWQFMYPTARMYSLNINSYFDDRKDPLLATEAAARYLKDLHNIYDDWAMALAAYNCGPGNVNKAIRRSGGKKTYWEIRDYLPKETRGYVPAFIAATYAMHYFEEHNIVPMVSELYAMPLDTVIIDQELSFEQISNVLDIPVEELSFFNPSVKRNVIPYTKEGFALKLPFEKVSAFIDLQDSIFNYNEKPVEPVINEPLVAQAPLKDEQKAPVKLVSTGSSEVANKNSKTKLYYTVKAGDNLGFISDWYNCNVNELKSWNKLRSTRINVGQKIIVYVPTSELSRYKNIDNLSSGQKSSIASNKSASSKATTADNTSESETETYFEYTIRSGDTLWGLSKRYSNNSVEDIKKLNNIPNGAIKPGMKLKLKK